MRVRYMSLHKRLICWGVGLIPILFVRAFKSIYYYTENRNVSLFLPKKGQIDGEGTASLKASQFLYAFAQKRLCNAKSFPVGEHAAIAHKFPPFQKICQMY